MREMTWPKDWSKENSWKRKAEDRDTKGAKTDKTEEGGMEVRRRKINKWSGINCVVDRK
jgi:hypothetical protein